MKGYKRVLLKLSGQVLSGDQPAGLDFKAIRSICEEVAEVFRGGIEIAMVVGGGNILRGKDAAEQGIERSQADYMGMLTTVINALSLQDTLEKLGIPTRVQTAVEMRQIAEPFIRRRALRHIEKGRIVIFAAGTGSPYFSTDTAAALRSAEIGADCLLKATKVDGIYNMDPLLNKDAERLGRLTYMDALQKQLNVMDAAAFSLCMENNIPIIVLNILKKQNLAKLLLKGENVGTIVTNAEEE